MRSERRWFLFWLWVLTSFCILGSLVSCRGVASPTSRLSTPFLVPTSEDIPRLAALTDELDGTALRCLEAANCDQVYYARAMVSLFENREAARASFRNVIQHNPASPRTHASQLWLQLMEHPEDAVPANDASLLTDIVAQFVREWLERQLSGRHLEQPRSPPTVQEHPIELSRVVQGLHKQVRERDRQLAGLRAQLDALKAID